MNVQFAKLQQQINLCIGLLLQYNGHQVIKKYELLIKCKLYKPTTILKILTFAEVKMTFFIHVILTSRVNENNIVTWVS